MALLFHTKKNFFFSNEPIYCISRTMMESLSISQRKIRRCNRRYKLTKITSYLSFNAVCCPSNIIQGEVHFMARLLVCFGVFENPFHRHVTFSSHRNMMTCYTLAMFALQVYMRIRYLANYQEREISVGSVDDENRFYVSQTLH